MGVKSMMADQLRSLYEALGDEVTVIIGGTQKTIFVQQSTSMFVETGKFHKFKAMESDVVGLSVGDTIQLNGATENIHAVDLSDDGLEMYIGVDGD